MIDVKRFCVMTLCAGMAMGSAKVLAQTPQQAQQQITKQAAEGVRVTGKVVLPKAAGKIEITPLNCHVQIRGIVDPSKIKGAFEPSADFEKLSHAEQQKQREAWSKSQAGKTFMATYRKLMRKQKSYQLKVDKNHRFEAAHVPAGKYLLNIQFSDYRGFNGELQKQFEVDGKGDFNLGNVVIKAFNDPKVGELAPVFDFVKLNGQQVNLKDFRGKYVILDFWATWCGPCVKETPNLVRAYEDFGAKGFDVIALSMDRHPDLPRKYVKDKGLKFTQGFIGGGRKHESNVLYGVRFIPSIWLIGPDGRVVAKKLRGEKIYQAVADAMKDKKAKAAVVD